MTGGLSVVSSSTLLSVGTNWVELTGVILLVSELEIVARVLGLGSDLSGGLVWWSGIGSLGGVITVGLLDLLVGSVIVDGSKTPDWLLGGDNSKKGSNCKSVFHC